MSALTNNPHAVRIVIPGKFWDSQLYSGTLVLFGLSGELREFDWNELVYQLALPPELKIVAEFALLGNHHLYEQGARLLLEDLQVRKVLRDKFDEIAVRSPWEVKLPAQNSRDNPLPFPHNDSEAHYHRLFVATSDGVFGSSVSGSKKGRVRFSDVPTLNIAAKFQILAQAAGNEGLYAAHVSEEPGTLISSASHHRKTQVSTLPCMSCEWGPSSVIACGSDNSVYIAPFNSIESRNSRVGGRRFEREFGEIISGDEILSRAGAKRESTYSWGAGDRIFRLADDHVEVVQQGRDRRRGYSFSVKGDIQINRTAIADTIVSARSAAFGNVVEGDDGLLVMLSTGESLFIAGEPTNWRVFPRSKNYLNHLHIAYRDRLEIWAFTHDYFVDQTDKLAGLTGLSGD